MSSKIVADSSCELNEELRNFPVHLVPFTMRLDGKEYRDDENLDVKGFIEVMKKSKNAPQSACPSTQDFMEAYEGEEDVFVVTISSKLSGCYNSAVLAKQLICEELKDKFIHIFDSKSAVAGETLIALKLAELIKKNYERLEIVEKVENYIKEMKTFFLLESLENLIKAGRMNKIVGQLASALSIKPIMGTDDGTIKLEEKTRGSKKAFKRFIEILGEQGENLQEKVLAISHCNCLDKALEFKKEVEARYNFKDIVITGMKGLSSMYAQEGGLVVTF